MELPRPFGPYTLLRRLAVGGMAEIYVAKTRGLQGFEKLAAIKVVHPHLSADAHFVRMLIEEAKILVLLSHANIAQVFDLGRIDGDYYIAMEFVEGLDVHGLQKAAKQVRRPVDLAVASYIAAEVCSGLDYAHRKRDHNGRPLHIVHRDISPQNVLISQAGEVKLVDFGIAKTSVRSEGTEVGVIKGKYYYMSPEQAWGDPMDRRSDIFSTGVLLWEMLAGRMLHQETSIPKLIAQVREAEVPPPHTVRPEVPKKLSAIVMRALARKQEDRYQSAMDFGEALRDYMYESAPAFNAARLSQWVNQLVEASQNAGSQETTRGALPALTREDFIQDEQSSLFKLPEGALATRNEVLPNKPAKPPPVPSAKPPPSAPPSPALSSAPPGAQPPPPPPALARGGSRRPPLPFDSVPPTEVMSRPPSIPGSKRVSQWPLPDAGYSEPPPDEPTQMWHGPTGEETTDETVIDDGVAVRSARDQLGLPPSIPPPPALPDDDPTGQYGPSHARALLQDAPSAPAPSGSYALNPPPSVSAGEGLVSIPPHPPLPELQPTGRIFRPRSRFSWPLAVIALLCAVFGAVAWRKLQQPRDPAVLEILSVPNGGKVRVDGDVQQGVTPLRISGLQLNHTYELAVELDGHQAWRAAYTAAPGVVQHIAVLKPLLADLHVTSEPSGADVWVDGVLIGRTPLMVSKLKLGRELQVRAQLAGYDPQETQFVVPTSDLKPKLQLALTKQQ